MIVNKLRYGLIERLVFIILLKNYVGLCIFNI
jgi:hypothetical protein